MDAWFVYVSRFITIFFERYRDEIVFLSSFFPYSESHIFSFVEINYASNRIEVNVIAINVYMYSTGVFQRQIYNAFVC